ncbi:MAG: DNA-binding response regulator [Bryobacteraceae bacterium]|nr:MAG: DNA-binding response regulator [Bryobacteraceae bacterium]
MSGRAAATIPTLVADDEAPALDELLYLLKSFPEIEVVGTAANGVEALKRIEELEPDLVFIDVQMPGLDGLSLIQKLHEHGAPVPAFVLCTAYEQYALEAFRMEALDYLLKPVTRERLALTIERVKRTMLEPEPPPAPQPPPLRKVLVKAGGKNLIVDAADVIYARIEDGLITVAATQVEGESNFKTLEELQATLDPAVFWRPHRSYLVNIHRIREVIPWFRSSYQIRMDDRKGTVIPVSRVQTRRLKELFRL